jgi:hypothetical protein
VIADGHCSGLVRLDARVGLRYVVRIVLAVTGSRVSDLPLHDDAEGSSRGPALPGSVSTRGENDLWSETVTATIGA